MEELDLVWLKSTKGSPLSKYLDQRLHFKYKGIHVSS